MLTGRVVSMLGVCLAISGCGNLSSRADGGCQMTVRSEDGWLLSGVTIPIPPPPNGASATIGAVTYSADQARELDHAATEVDQTRMKNCATMYAPEFANRRDSDRELVYARIIKAADGLARFGTALEHAKTVDAGLAAAQDARRTIEVINAASAASQAKAN